MSKITQTLGAIDRNFSKESLVQLARKHASEIVGNEQLDLLKIYVEFKRYETYLITLIGEMKNTALAKAQQEEKYRFAYAGAEIVVQNKRKYDYSTDQSWSEINDTMERLKTMKKSREQLLKNLKGVSKEVFNKDSGELEFVQAPRAEAASMLLVRL